MLHPGKITVLPIRHNRDEAGWRANEVGGLCDRVHAIVAAPVEERLRADQSAKSAISWEKRLQRLNARQRAPRIEFPAA